MIKWCVLTTCLVLCSISPVIAETGEDELDYRFEAISIIGEGVVQKCIDKGACDDDTISKCITKGIRQHLEAGLAETIKLLPGESKPQEALQALRDFAVDAEEYCLDFGDGDDEFDDGEDEELEDDEDNENIPGDGGDRPQRPIDKKPGSGGNDSRTGR